MNNEIKMPEHKREYDSGFEKLAYNLLFGTREEKRTLHLITAFVFLLVIFALLTLTFKCVRLSREVDRLMGPYELRLGVPTDEDLPDPSAFDDTPSTDTTRLSSFYGSDIFDPQPEPRYLKAEPLPDKLWDDVETETDRAMGERFAALDTSGTLLETEELYVSEWQKIHEENAKEEYGANALCYYLLFSDRGFRVLALAVFCVLFLLFLIFWVMANNARRPKTVRVKETVTNVIEPGPEYLKRDDVMEHIRKDYIDSLPSKYGFYGEPASDEFLEWAYRRIITSDDFSCEDKKIAALNHLQWGFIANLWEYDRWVDEYAEVPDNFIDRAQNYVSYLRERYTLDGEKIGEIGEES